MRGRFLLSSFVFLVVILSFGFLVGADSYSFQNEMWGRWSPNVNWVDVVVGDFNGDGRHCFWFTKGFRW